LRICSHYESKKNNPKTQKRAQTEAEAEGQQQRCAHVFRAFKIDLSLSFSLTASAPPPRVNTRDAAIAESGVTTLDRVTVSDIKKGRMYISFRSGLTSAVG
jgi:hypothetical protein